MFEKILSKSIKINRNKADILAGAVVAALALLLLIVEIPLIPVGQSGLSRGANNPRTMPYIVATVFLVMGVLILLRGITSMRKAKADKEGKPVEEATFMVIAVVLAAIGIVYALLFRVVGYIPLNLISMILVYYLFGGTKWYEALILSVVFTAIMVLFFKYYLLINIPLGLGIG